MISEVFVPPLCAVRYVGLTVEAGKAWFARASVAVDVVSASASVFAGDALALIHLNGATWACKARQAGAVVSVNAVCAGASTETWI